MPFCHPRGGRRAQRCRCAWQLCLATGINRTSSVFRPYCVFINNINYLGNTPVFCPHVAPDEIVDAGG